jgi:hypothetical protein
MADVALLHLHDRLNSFFSTCLFYLHGRPLGIMQLCNHCLQPAYNAFLAPFANYI